MHVSDIDKVAPAEAMSTTGTHSVLVILVNWTAPDSVTPRSATTQIGVVDDAWYEEVSYGRFGLQGTSTPWLSISSPGSTCAAGTIQTASFAAARTAGFEPAAYDHQMIYFPRSTTCSWGGLGQVGGSVTWINGAMNAYVTIHELGHNLGLWHASSYACRDSAGSFVPYSDTCTATEYGDPFDAMGLGYLNHDNGHFNTIEKADLGWMSLSAVQAAGSYQLHPHEVSTEGLMLAPASGRPIWLEYRQPLGVDSWLPTGATGGILVHTRAPNGNTYLLDMTPDGSFWDAALRGGESWTDPVSGWTVRVGTLSSTSATVSVVTPTVEPPGVPESHFYQPSGMSTTTDGIPASISWTASTSPGATYTLQARFDGGTWQNWLVRSTSLGYDTRLQLGTTYQLRVRATVSGVNSTWATNTPFEVIGFQDGALRYRGSWTKASSTNYWGGSVMITKASGASVALTFNARNVSVIGTMGPGYGGFSQYVDGVKVPRSPSSYSTTMRFRQVIAYWGWHETGTHTLKLVDSATPGHPRLAIDGIVIYK